VLEVLGRADGDQAFVVLAWTSKDESRFADAEYLKVQDGRITEILVLNNSRSFGELLV
jgi:hypothetical protein